MAQDKDKEDIEATLSNNSASRGHQASTATTATNDPLIATAHHGTLLDQLPLGPSTGHTGPGIGFGGASTSTLHRSDGTNILQEAQVNSARGSTTDLYSIKGQIVRDCNLGGRHNIQDYQELTRIAEWKRYVEQRIMQKRLDWERRRLVSAQRAAARERSLAAAKVRDDEDKES